MSIIEQPATAERKPGSVVLAAVLAGTFVLLAYPMVGIVREVLGEPGVATSPLIAAPAL